MLVSDAGGHLPQEGRGKEVLILVLVDVGLGQEEREEAMEYFKKS